MIECRRFREEDYDIVCDFLIELNRKDRTHINWNWARFEWMFEHPECDRSLLGSIGLWFDEERVVGAAIYDMYFGEAFCGVLPEYSGLYPEVLKYAWRELKDESGLGIAVCDENKEEIEAASSFDFSPADQTETIMVCDLEKLLPCELPEGFHLEPVDPIDRSEDLQWLFWQGFDHGEDRSEFEKNKTPVSRIRKHFDPELSLIAASPDGTLAACCCLWYHPDTDYAYVEPVCTIPSCREKGLAKAMLIQAMCRAKEKGALRAYVISDSPFYEKTGFEKDKHYTFYWKV